MPRWQELRGMAKYFGMLLIGTGASALRGQTDRLVLALLATPAWVGAYGIAAKVSSLIMEANSLVYIPIMAASGTLHASGNWNDIQNLYSRIMKVLPFIVGCATIVLLGVQREIQIFWLHEFIPESQLILWFILLGNVTAVTVAGPGTSILKGIGNLKIETNYLLMNLILNLLCTVLFVWWLGPFGTVLSSGLTWAVTSIMFVLLMHRRYDLPWRATRNAGLAMILMLVCGIAAYGVSACCNAPTDRFGALVQGTLIAGPMLAIFTYLYLVMFITVKPLSTARGYAFDLMRLYLG